MKFDWDPNKNDSNKDKHGIDFNKAKEVFKDPNLVKMNSKHKSSFEERLIAVGEILANLFSVIYTMRDNITRIISARRSNKQERKAYSDNLKNKKTD